MVIMSFDEVEPGSFSDSDAAPRTVAPLFIFLEVVENVDLFFRW